MIFYTQGSYFYIFVTFCYIFLSCNLFMNHIVTLLYHKQKTMKALTLTLILFLTNQLFAQTVQTQFIKSEIKKVKLFLTSGEMYHDQTVKLQKGRNKLIFTGISGNAPRFTSLTSVSSKPS